MSAIHDVVADEKYAPALNCSVLYRPAMCYVKVNSLIFKESRKDTVTVVKSAEDKCTDKVSRILLRHRQVL